MELNNYLASSPSWLLYESESDFGYGAKSRTSQDDPVCHVPQNSGQLQEGWLGLSESLNCYDTFNDVILSEENFNADDFLADLNLEQPRLEPEAVRKQPNKITIKLKKVKHLKTSKKNQQSLSQIASPLNVHHHSSSPESLIQMQIDDRIQDESLLFVEQNLDKLLFENQRTSTSPRTEQLYQNLTLGQVLSMENAQNMLDELLKKPEEQNSTAHEYGVQGTNVPDSRSSGNFDLSSTNVGNLDSEVLDATSPYPEILDSTQKLDMSSLHCENLYSTSPYHNEILYSSSPSSDIMNSGSPYVDDLNDLILDNNLQSELMENIDIDQSDSIVDLVWDPNESFATNSPSSSDLFSPSSTVEMFDICPTEGWSEEKNKISGKNTGIKRKKFSAEVRHLRKKDQNKMAALKYRNKKKGEDRELAAQVQRTFEEQEELLEKQTDLKKEISSLKKLLLEAYRVKGQRFKH